MGVGEVGGRRTVTGCSNMHNGVEFGGRREEEGSTLSVCVFVRV